MTMTSSHRKQMLSIISIFYSCGVFLLPFLISVDSVQLVKTNQKPYYTIVDIGNIVGIDSENGIDFEEPTVKVMAGSDKNINIATGESAKIGESLNELNKPVHASWPVVINTWAFTEGTKSAWDVLSMGGSALDAIEQGCSRCEELQCDGTVGFGGSPDENGETTLDAMIMDGETHAVGAVGCLRRVKNAIGVARKILEHTGHTLLVGELASDFASKMGFKVENLTTEYSQKMHDDWKENGCQPNFWRNVKPDPTKNCGPYSPSITSADTHEKRPDINKFNHDTISMIAIDWSGKIASGTSSNGARHKIPGRVGDAPITGAGSYVDKEVGGAGATGDGDIMARFLPSLITVEEMRRGKTPEEAARYAISRITGYFPTFSGAVIAVNIQGDVGAACHNIPNGFPFSYVRQSPDGVSDVKVDVAVCT